MLRFPSDEDLTGAAVALMRLQDTYMLDTHALAEGKLLGKKYSRRLTGNQRSSFSELPDAFSLLITTDLLAASWRLLGTGASIVQ